MTTARDIMKPGVQWISKDTTIEQAARTMAELNVGSLIISDQNERMCGIVTDRDIVVKCIAQGKAPSDCQVDELCESTPRWVDANADIAEVLDEMESNRVKRMPVIEDKRLVGMISEADLARHLDDNQLGEFVTAVYGRP
ncbi:CBS domain-containing protein [Nocardia arthritidis]|uniref:CBS domain-containing protein n=1 Tax=Nocardia arthritidis TaxID=228602 RepID=UPI0007A3F259|nr:CBS domain-containing protein [Nocardia arthritidis]